MKSGTTEHPKFLALLRAIGRPKYVGVGILESLWMAAAKWKDHGGIGEWTNEMIASSVEWEGNADELIDVLKKTGWIDTHTDYRLMIHDWADHQPKYVTDRVRKRENKGGSGKSATFEKGSGKSLPTQPNPTQPDPTQPNHKTPLPPQGGSSELFENFWSRWPDHPRKAAKTQCFRKWKRQDCEVNAEQVLTALDRWKASPEWTKNAGEFIPAPLVWINQRRWESTPGTATQGEVPNDRHSPEVVRAILEGVE